MGYKHGSYGIIGNDKVKSAVQVGTVAAYVGTAPINLIKGYATKNLINTPIRLENMQKVQQTVGYSDTWNEFTLCEAFDEHFANTIENVGPIYIINVLNPTTHRKAIATTVDVDFGTIGSAEVESDTVILDTFVLEDKIRDVDYAIDYDYTKGAVIITSLKTSEPLLGEIQVTYSEVDTTLITKADIIGSVTPAGQRTGLQALTKLYTTFNAVLNILAVPFWSEYPDVYKAMVAIVQKLNGHWDGFINADIPLVDEESILIDTIEKASAWAEDNGYNSGFSKPHWPQIKYGAKTYHLSTVTTATMLRVDHSHNDIPMESPSNKEIMCTAQYFGAGADNEGFDQQEGNTLNEHGITTAVFWGGKWVLWGPHTGNFEYGRDGIARYIFDVNIRMLMYITNGFQLRHGTQIDGTMDLNLQQSILLNEQENLDALVSVGALIGNPVVQFIETENPTSEVMNGDFVWNISATPTPPFKSGTAKVSYTDEGFAAYIEGGE